MKKKKKLGHYHLLLCLLVWGFFGCSTNSSLLMEHNSGVVYQHRQTELLEGATDVSKEGVSQNYKPLSLIPSPEIPETFKVEKNKKGQVKLHEKPILTFFFDPKQKTNLPVHKKWLSQKTDSSLSTFVKPFQDFIIVPYKTSESLLENYLEQDYHLSQLPPVQWAAGMLGADGYLLFSIDEKKLIDYRFTVSATLYMTFSGKTVYHCSETVKPSSDLSEAALNKERERLFSLVYKKVMDEATLAIAENLAFGKYRQLVFNKAKGDLSSVDLISGLNNEKGIFAKEVISEGGDLILDVWSNINDSDFESLVVKEIADISKRNKTCTLIMQDRMVYFFGVEKIEKK